MSIALVKVWKCDSCGKEVRLERYGLPPEWVYIKGIGPVKHACDTCQLSIPENLKGRPKT